MCLPQPNEVCCLTKLKINFENVVLGSLVSNMDLHERRCKRSSGHYKGLPVISKQVARGIESSQPVGFDYADSSPSLFLFRSFSLNFSGFCCVANHFRPLFPTNFMLVFRFSQTERGDVGDSVDFQCLSVAVSCGCCYGWWCVWIARTIRLVCIALERVVDQRETIDWKLGIFDWAVIQREQLAYLLRAKSQGYCASLMVSPRMVRKGWASDSIDSKWM